MGARRSDTSDAHRLPSQPGESHTRRRRSTARLLILSVTAVAVVMVAAACSRVLTHRVLSFLYDGVPPLESGIAQPEIEASETSAEAIEGEPSGRREVVKKFYSHPAYRNNLCGGCHDVKAGKLLKTARQGLCQTCHPDKPAKKKFVHGPVAVNGCLACHRYHKSMYPKVLITDAQSLCYSCHVTEELVTDKHHATIEEKRCIDCHDAHGGDDRFFLLPGVVEEDPP